MLPGIDTCTVFLNISDDFGVAGLSGTMLRGSLDYPDPTSGADICHSDTLAFEHAAIRTFRHVDILLLAELWEVPCAFHGCDLVHPIPHEFARFAEEVETGLEPELGGWEERSMTLGGMAVGTHGEVSRLFNHQSGAAGPGGAAAVRVPPSLARPQLLPRGGGKPTPWALAGSVTKSQRDRKDAIPTERERKSTARAMRGRRSAAAARGAALSLQ
eukprot:gene3308-biopygen554